MNAREVFITELHSEPALKKVFRVASYSVGSWLRALVAPAEDLGLVPSSHEVAHSHS